MSRTTAVPTPIRRPHAGGAFTGNDLAADRFRVEMPIHAHALCLAKCDEKSPEYRLLRNAIILHDDPHKVTVHIRCNADKVSVIRRIMAKQCPEFSDELYVYPDPT